MPYCTRQRTASASAIWRINPQRNCPGGGVCPTHNPKDMPEQETSGEMAGQTSTVGK